MIQFESPVIGPGTQISCVPLQTAGGSSPWTVTGDFWEA
jgi:hypothetical protein